MVQLLVLKGADINAMDEHGRTPLYAATRFGHVVPALALIAGGADVNIVCGLWRVPVVLLAAEKGHMDILRAAVNHGADHVQRTALHAVAQNNKAEAVDVLVEAGANIEARNSDGWTPGHFGSNRVSHLLRASVHRPSRFPDAIIPDLYITLWLMTSPLNNYSKTASTGGRLPLSRCRCSLLRGDRRRCSGRLGGTPGESRRSRSRKIETPCRTIAGRS